MLRSFLNRPRCRPHGARPRRAKSRPALEPLEGRTVPSFAAPAAYAVGSDPAAVIAADFNNDGRTDLAAANLGADSVSVLPGNGDGTFQPARHSPGAPEPVSLTAADFNGDGLLDLVTTHPGSYSASLAVLPGQGDGSFQAPVTYHLDFEGFSVGALNLSVAAGDVNGDGPIDLVALWDAVDFSVWQRTLLNNGDGTFTPLPVTLSEGYSYNPMTLADVDEDGRLDLLADHGWWRGNGDGTFTFATFEVHAQVVADFNGDRHLDAAAAGNELSVQVRLGTGTGGFGGPQSYSTPRQQPNAPLGAGDLHSDGHLDLLVRTDGGVSVLPGTGDGTFADALTFSAAGGTLAVADFNGDGRADFASNDGAAGQVLVFLNDGVWDLPLVGIADVSVTEGNSGAVAAVFTVTLSGPSARTITVDYATQDSEANAGSDYAAAGGTVTFLPGETSKTIAVSVFGDRLGEPNETFFVNLGNPANASIADYQGVGTIVDDEPRVSINNVLQAEGRRGKTYFTFTVTLSQPSDVPVTLSFATADGTARGSDGDYQAASGTLTFAPGETSKTITVRVNGDRRREGDETFFVNLSEVVNALLADGQGVGIILNDD